MRKKLAILAVAFLWFLETIHLPSPLQAAQKKNSAATKSTKKTVQSKPRQSVKAQPKKKRVRSRRRLSLSVTALSSALKTPDS